MEPATVAIDLALIAACGGLVGLDRRGAFQAMISQPLVAVPLLGALLGQLEVGLALGAALQLLWMSSMLFGANTPPNETLASMVAGGMVLLYGKHIATPDIAVMTVGILLAVPLGPLGRAIDVRLERINLALSQRALAAVAESRVEIIDRLPWIALGRVFSIHAALIALGSGIGLIVLAAVHPLLDGAVLAAIATAGMYLVPALGLAVAFSLVRRRRGIALGLLTFVAVAIMLDHGGAG